MKTIFSFLTFLFLSNLFVFGQNHFIGLKGGIHHSNVTSSNFIVQNDFRTGILTGITYDYLISKNYVFGVELLYNQRGFTNDIEFMDDFGNLSGERFTSHFNYDYVSLPLKIGFNVGNKFYGFSNVGLIPSLLVEANTKTPTFELDGTLRGNESLDVTSSVSKFDLAGSIEVGGGYKITNRIWTYASFAYQHSFITISNSEYFANSTILHNGMTVSLGVKYAIIK